MSLAWFECPCKGPGLVLNPHETKNREGNVKAKRKRVCRSFCAVCARVLTAHVSIFYPPPSAHALLLMIFAIVSSVCPLDAVSRAQQQAWLCEQAKKTKCSPFEVLCWLKRVREKDYHVMPHLLLLANILLQDMCPPLWWAWDECNTWRCLPPLPMKMCTWDPCRGWRFLLDSHFFFSFLLSMCGSWLCLLCVQPLAVRILCQIRRTVIRL